VPEEPRTSVGAIAEEMSHMPADTWVSFAVANTFLPALLAQLVAKDLGFDSCLMTHFQPEEYSRILGLPANLIPSLLCPLGYAADQPLPKWRYSVDEILIP
jgi:nitroreductase/dihydropteridine reductase